MTLPASPNSISMSQVNQELGRASPYTQTVSLNDSVVRTLAGVASGAISMDNLRGKSNRASASYTYSASTSNASLNISTLSGYVAGTTDVTITVNSGVYLWASTTGNYALNITGATAGDKVILVNAGFIMGCGGAGAWQSGAATAGGPAINTPVAMSVNNTGYIGGGGGGGATGGVDHNGLGGGGAGGGAGGYWSGYSAASGGAIGAAGGNGTGALLGAGAGGRIMPGSGGAGGSISAGNAMSYGSTQTAAGTGGGSGGGGSATINNVNYAPSATAGSGGSAGGVGGTGTGTASKAGAGGGGGGWGAAGGNSNGTISYAAAAGGKAINTNGNTITWVAGQTNVYGSVS